MMFAEHALASTEQAQVLIALAIISAVTTIIGGYFSYKAKMASNDTTAIEELDQSNKRQHAEIIAMIHANHPDTPT